VHRALDHRQAIDPVSGTELTTANAHQRLD